MTRPQNILRAAGACAAPGAIAVAAALAAGAPAADPAAADAARAGARPGAGGVAIARRRLNVVAGRRALVSGRVAGAEAGRTVALERRAGDGWRTVDRARTAAGGAFSPCASASRPRTSASGA
jgi:hypothetical protein